jgi:hypothetical protein
MKDNWFAKSHHPYGIAVLNQLNCVEVLRLDHWDVEANTGYNIFLH